MAWVFSEHTRITQRALDAVARVQGVDIEWLTIAEQRLNLTSCESGACPSAALRLAALPALAGDHSCTPQALRHMLAQVDGGAAWIYDVLNVAAGTDRALREVGGDAAKREDIRRRMHLDLQWADPRYMSRAQSAASHFQLARELSMRMELPKYLRVALDNTQPANATAAYVNYHVLAVRQAMAARQVQEQEARTEHVVQALVFEAFALHFLQDAFAAGHIIGHWGDVPTRLGTHDFYSRVGVAAVRWNDLREPYVAYGDAFLTEGELGLLAEAVKLSLLQVLDPCRTAAVWAEAEGAFAHAHYDSCSAEPVPPGLSQLAHSTQLQQVLAYLPVPALRTHAQARVRAEGGFFFGAAASGGYGAVMEGAQVLSFGAALRLGAGVAAISTDPLNAQLFADLGFFGSYLITETQNTPQVGYSLRVRAPGYLFWLDGLLASALSLLWMDDCAFCLQWAVVGAAGGAGGLWRSHLLSSAVSWQFSFLRDVSLRLLPNARDTSNYRTELLLPALTLRAVVPIAGATLSQSADAYLDIGPSFTWSAQQPSVQPGVFLSLTVTPRLFP